MINFRGEGCIAEHFKGDLAKCVENRIKEHSRALQFLSNAEKVSCYLENFLSPQEEQEILELRVRIAWFDCALLALEGVYDALAQYDSKIRHEASYYLQMYYPNKKQPIQILQNAPGYSEILRQLPAAAGARKELKNIPQELLKATGLPEDTSIVCTPEEKDYSIRIQSSVPVSCTLIFMKDDQELFRTEVSREIPDKDELILEEDIRGWTSITVLRHS